MTLDIINGDLFTVGKEYYLAHCISLDCRMGSGIALEFSNKFPKMKQFIKRVILDKNIISHPAVIVYSYNGYNIFNLITKRNYNNKPSYKSLEICLLQMAYYCNENNITKLAMPIIGCGLDKLKWDKVKEIIERVFSDNNIEIKIYNK